MPKRIGYKTEITKAARRRAVSTKQLILRMVKIIRSIIYLYDSILLAATVCKKPASPQGIAALAVQESVDTLTKRSDEHSQSGCFSLPTENEARRLHDTPDRRV